MAVFNVTYLRENHIMEPSLMDTINYYDNLIQESFNEFDHQMYILSEADEMGVDGAKQSLAEKIKEFINGLIEKIKELWKRFKAKISELKDKIFKKENKSDDKEKEDPLLLMDKSSLIEKAKNDLKDLKFYTVPDSDYRAYPWESEEDIMKKYEDTHGFLLYQTICDIIKYKDDNKSLLKNYHMTSYDQAEKVYDREIELLKYSSDNNIIDPDDKYSIKDRYNAHYKGFVAACRMAAINAESYAKVKAYFKNIAR